MKMQKIYLFVQCLGIGKLPVLARVKVLEKRGFQKVIFGLPPGGNPMTTLTSVCCALALAITADPRAAGEIAFREEPGQLVITAGAEPVATYCYRDKEITRPYFAHAHVPGGIQITRNHPPINGKDLVDHATFHPGIWLAFGDINGQDYWRIGTPVRHVRLCAASRKSSDQRHVYRREFLRCRWCPGTGSMSRGLSLHDRSFARRVSHRV